MWRRRRFMLMAYASMSWVLCYYVAKYFKGNKGIISWFALVCWSHILIRFGLDYISFLSNLLYHSLCLYRVLNAGCFRVFILTQLYYYFVIYLSLWHTLCIASRKALSCRHSPLFIFTTATLISTIYCFVWTLIFLCAHYTSSNGRDIYK